MDLTTLTYIVFLALGSIGLDTALHPASVVLDSAVPNKIDTLTADSDAIDRMLGYEVDRISSTQSVLAVPEIRVGASKGIGMAIAQALNLQSVALAWQAQLGYQPERIHLTLLENTGTVRMLVSGAGPGGKIATPPFQLLLTLRNGETLSALVHRAAVAGLSRIDPYITSLYLLQTHALDGNFTEAEVLINEIKTQLPPTPISYERSLFENLQGIIDLFQNRPAEARNWFHAAALSDPDNAVAALNFAFVDLQVGEYHDAIGAIRHLLTLKPPVDKILLATAYLEWAAAQLGLHDVSGADQTLAKAVEIYPESSVAYDLWSIIKREKSNPEAASHMHDKALEYSGTFENYSEVAALYFRIPWKENQPIVRSPFVNPNMLRFN